MWWKGLFPLYSSVLIHNLGYQQGHGAEDDQTLQGRQEERTGLCQEQAKARGAWKQSPPEDQEGASRLPRKLGKTEISSGVLSFPFQNRRIWSGISAYSALFSFLHL